jgi:hypothetical protein
MMSRSIAATSLVALLAGMAGAPACSSDSGTAAPPPGTGYTADGGDSGGSDGGKAGSDANIAFETGGAGGCTSASDCDGGACVSGACCAAANACGESCCTDGQLCFANACVVPGKVCHSAADCEPGQYCELSLGDNPDAGADGGPDPSDANAPDATDPDAAAPKYCAPSPPAGRCLALPPVCGPEADGGLPDGGACVQACEYHPEAGALQVVQKWAWGPVAELFPNFTDVWSTPLIGRVTDTNCDGAVDELDPPNVIFVSGNVKGTCCHCTGDAVSACKNGVLRVLDGRTGKEVWSLRKASANSIGFAGLTHALGDVDGDGRMDIVAATGEGRIVLIDAEGNIKRTSDKPVPGAASDSFGWGGGLALADMDGDGHAEIAFGATVFTTTDNAITLKFTGTQGDGASNVGASTSLSTFVDLDGDGALELLAGKTAYKFDGTILWNRADLNDGFSGVGDFDGDGLPEAVLVTGGKLYLLEGSTGATELGPLTLGATGFGGPPTVADFDGDKKPEVGIAQQQKYTVAKADYVGKKLDVLWQTANHDLSSSVTGSSVFDFEGDGRAEVIYADECFLWVYDGMTGKPLFATPKTSFTGTEASLVADIDGDGHAEILTGSNGVDPSSAGWGCNVAPWNQPDPATGRPAWKPPAGATAYRGVVVYGDKSNGWVGTRTLWNQHTYHVSNICDSRDSACDAPNVYGSIPAKEKANWTVPWLNNFRQNVQDKGLFDAPDATVTLRVKCTSPLLLEAMVRNLGQAILPAGVEVGFYLRKGTVDTLLGTATTDAPLFPGQVKVLSYTAKPADALGNQDVFVAKVLIDAQNLQFHECRDDNNTSPEATPSCQSVQ